MDHQVVGTTLPVLEMTLQPGERIVAQAGELSWMTSSIELHTTTDAGGSKGLFGAFTRAVGGGSFFMTQYTAKDAPGMVAFATKVPGSILPINVSGGQSDFVHRTGCLCATDGVAVSVRFERTLGGRLYGESALEVLEVATPYSARLSW